jgi:hypothetical protein
MSTKGLIIFGAQRLEGPTVWFCFSSALFFMSVLFCTASYIFFSLLLFFHGLQKYYSFPLFSLDVL